MVVVLVQYEAECDNCGTIFKTYRDQRVLEFKGKTYWFHLCEVCRFPDIVWNFDKMLKRRKKVNTIDRNSNATRSNNVLNTRRVEKGGKKRPGH